MSYVLSVVPSIYLSDTQRLTVMVKRAILLLASETWKEKTVVDLILEPSFVIVYPFVSVKIRRSGQWEYVVASFF